MDGSSFLSKSMAKNQLDKRLCNIRGLSEATITDSFKMAGDEVASKARKEKGITLVFKKQWRATDVSFFFSSSENEFWCLVCSTW